MKQVKRIIFAGLLTAVAVLAQPVVDSALNSASYALPGMPNYGISQGSLFVVFGKNLGPPGLNQVTAYPLPTSLNGVSIKVTVGATVVDCIIMNSYGAGATPATQVVGILPSTTPVGTGTLVLTYGGQSSAPIQVKVVAHVFGIYAINAGGSGPGVVTDANYQVRLVTQSSTARQILIIWGTGLGAITGDDRQPPVPRDMTELDVKVYAGGKLATVLYRGRSGGAGLDQINFAVPDGLAGCYVPLVVVVNGIASNWVSLPVAANNGACSDDNGLTAQEIDAAKTRGYLRTGSISLDRTTMSMTIPGFGSFTTTTDSGSAFFERFEFLGLISSQGFGGYSSVGSCSVFQYSGTQGATDPVVPVYLDAGAALSVTGPKGAKQIPVVQGMKGLYSATLGGGGNPITGGGLPDYLDVAGTYTTTGPGGVDVGAINTSLMLPTGFTWTNQNAITNIPRSQDLSVTWNGGPQGGIVTIIGSSSITTPMQAGAMFICTAPVAAGQFSVPSVVLSALPVSEVTEGVGSGLLILGTSTAPVRFTATGLDVGTYTGSWSSGKLVAYQ